MKKIDRFRGALLGLACGDAVGTTVEFKPRGTFATVTEMVGGGPFALKKGEWTDDTSMALCLASSLIELERFDARDQMRRYCRWMDDGYYASNGTCFDIGITVEDALMAFKESGVSYSGSTDRYAAGNGCLMRLAPIPMFFSTSRLATSQHALLSAKTTHGADECLQASVLFADMLYRAFAGARKEAILNEDAYCQEQNFSASIAALARGDYRVKTSEDIRGTGYVVDSLEAALWCFSKAHSVEETILMAANLGDDADTTAAIAGQLAGAFYGVAAIPKNWLAHLVMRDEITELADRLLTVGGASTEAAYAPSAVVQGVKGKDGVPAAFVVWDRTRVIKAAPTTKANDKKTKG